MKRGRSGLVAVIAVDKPEGCSSHDVVNMVRRATGEVRVGHAGTLDPFATGLLIVCIGAATRLSNRIMASNKTYEARIAFGVQTDTDDITGKRLSDACFSGFTGDDASVSVSGFADANAGVSAKDLASANASAKGFAAADVNVSNLASVGVSTRLDLEQTSKSLKDPLFAQDILNQIVGTFEQIPPAYSAKKIGGKRSYSVARQGGLLDLPACEVTVFAAKLLDLGTIQDGPDKALPYWDVSFEVSKGTYIRSIARDIGLKLGCGAHLAALRRTASGSLSVEGALDPQNLGDLSDAAKLEKVAIDPVSLLGLPAIEVYEPQMKRINNGAPFTLNAEQLSHLRNAAQLSTTTVAEICIVYKQRLQAIYKPLSAADASALNAVSTPSVDADTIGLKCELKIDGGVCGL